MNPYLDNKLQEQIVHTTKSAPIRFIIPMHQSTWHLLYIYTGIVRWNTCILLRELLFQIENQTFLLHAKEGIFIPAELLHTAKNTGNTPVSFFAFVFSSSF